MWIRPARAGCWLLASVTPAVILAVLGSAAPALGSAAPASGGIAGWPTAGHDIGNSRDAAGEHTIGPRNVSQLTTAWSITTTGDVMTTPTVYGGTVYFPDLGGKLWAVTAGNGQVLWSHAISAYTGITGDLSRTSPAVYGNELVLGDTSATMTTLGHGAFVVAVDRRTGQLLWRTEVGTNPAAIVTSSPVIYRGVAYLGVSSARGRYRGECARLSLLQLPGQRGGPGRGDRAAAVADVHRAGRQHRRCGLGQYPGNQPGGQPALRGDREQLFGTGGRVHLPRPDRLRTAPRG